MEARRGDAGSAVRAGAVAVGEGRDDDVALVERADLGASVLDHGDELVADGPARLVGSLPAVEPHVRTADAGEDDADDGIGGVDDLGVGPIDDFDLAGLGENCSTHGCRASLGGWKWNVDAVRALRAFGYTPVLRSSSSG